MQDQHPIDSLFREALQGASSAPPPRLWNSLVQERERRRRLAAWRVRRNWGLALLLFVLVGAGAYWSVSTKQLDLPATTIADASKPVVPSHDALSGPHGIAEIQDVPAGSTTEETEPIWDLTERNESVVVRDVLSSKGNDRDPGSKAKAPAVSTVVQKPTVTMIGSPVIEEVSPIGALDDPIVTSGSSVAVGDTDPLFDLAPSDEHFSIVRMRPRAFHPAPPLVQPSCATETPYVLARGQWWISAQVGLYNVKRQWSGAPGQLTDALNGSEAWHSTVALGGMVGRSWRSGIGVDVGLSMERSEQAFHHLDRQEHTEEIINTHLVTLNTQVFVSSVDTTSVSVVDERVVDGLDQRQIVRASAEFFWHTGPRRFRLGPRVGLGVDFTKVSSVGSVAYNEVEGRLERSTLPASAMNARYPTMVLGMTGVDLDYSILEQWSIGVTPLGMFAIGTVGDRASVYSSPTRLGFRFRITHTLSH